MAEKRKVEIHWKEGYCPRRGSPRQRPIKSQIQKKKKKKKSGKFKRSENLKVYFHLSSPHYFPFTNSIARCMETISIPFAFSDSRSLSSKTAIPNKLKVRLNPNSFASSNFSTKTALRQSASNLHNASDGASRSMFDVDNSKSLFNSTISLLFGHNYTAKQKKKKQDPFSPSQPFPTTTLVGLD
jgi:hypothetical protein